MKFVIVQAVNHRTSSYLITLKPCVCSPLSSVLQAACNLTGVVSSSGNVSQSCFWACDCKIRERRSYCDVLTCCQFSNVGDLFCYYARCHAGLLFYSCFVFRLGVKVVDSSGNVMAHGDAREGKWRGNWQMEWVTSTLHTTLEHGVPNITTTDAHNSAASSQLNWCPRRFKWTYPFPQRRNLVSACVPSYFNWPLLDSLSFKNYCSTGSFVESIFFLLIKFLYLSY